VVELAVDYICLASFVLSFIPIFYIHRKNVAAKLILGGHLTATLFKVRVGLLRGPIGGVELACLWRAWGWGVQSLCCSWVASWVTPGLQEVTGSFHTHTRCIGTKRITGQ